MLLLLSASAALAASLSGDFLTIDYDDGGTWNNGTDLVGYRAEVGGAQVEFTYAGSPYQAWGVGYDGPEGWQTYVANSAFGDSILVLSGEDTSTPGNRAYTWKYLTPELEVTKTEWFDERDVSTAVQFTLTNKGATVLDGVQVLYALDPDPDAATYGDYTTVEAVGDADRDGHDDWAAASGPSSGVTIGLGACDASSALLGFFSSWQSETPVDVLLTDPAGASGDDAMALQYYAPRPLAPGESLSFRLVVAVDATAADAAETFLGLAPDVCCDQDGDGEPGVACGGADCDDATADVTVEGDVEEVERLAKALHCAALTAAWRPDVT